ncbi:DUF1858 domain-containing protein [Enterococcus hirae]|jgi:hypothetical protein|nr:DUF1858 domain-containing protein [Enterococcaceae bacterium]MCI1919224.1 DUF1858 domain-containing protein [Enterococcaceae bacterium]MDM8213843.1 DUF1858 domain-containing protein [Enterococcus hirae]
METIHMNQAVAAIVLAHPELAEDFFALGFKHAIQPEVLKKATCGTTLAQGMLKKGIPMEKLQDILARHQLKLAE